MQNKVNTPPIYFWIISGFALFWRITGAVNFLNDLFISNDLVDNLNNATSPVYTKKNKLHYWYFWCRHRSLYGDNSFYFTT
jgi:hypothetical protein